MRADARQGILLMVAACVVFALQDAISRHLADATNVLMVVMVRYWFFALFALLLARARAGSIRAAARTARPLLQGARGVLLAAEICVTITAFTLLGLTESHAVFACAPLIVAALSGPVLGERVGWRRWAAIGTGFVGILVILRPGFGVLNPAAAVPLLGAAMWALYGLLTRLATRDDGTTTSFLWVGVTGAIAMTVVGLPAWEPMGARDWAMMAALCMTGATGHWLLIKCYEGAEASAVQPFAYLQLPFAAGVGAVAFGERPALNVVVGAAIVVGAGLFALWRERVALRGRAEVPQEGRSQGGAGHGLS